ncbi:MAG: hypothetical protein AABY33_04990 [Pseudomonadota bacterium]|mgnify:CR=1 FL=1
MKKSFMKKYSLLLCLLSVSACTEPYNEVAVDSGDPERLIDNSSETVTFGLKTKKSLSRLSDMIKEDRPSSVELRCSLSNSRCAQAKEIFERGGIQMNFSSEQSNSVVLSYNRVMVRDCDQRFVDNMSGNRSINHPAFGCSIAGNMVQMVSDKSQFTSPSLTDLPDAEKLGQSYSDYLKPSSKREIKSAEWSSSTSAK